MKNTTFLLALVCLVVLSCQNDSTVDQEPPKKGDNFTFFESKSLYHEALEKRSGDYSAPFEIKKVERVKGAGDAEHDFIHITVEHNKECSGDFELIWSGAVMESYPPQTHIAVRYQATCRDSGQLVQTVLSVDLDTFIGDEELVEIAMFHILNTSKMTPEDGDVASEPMSGN